MIQRFFALAAILTCVAAAIAAAPSAAAAPGRQAAGRATPSAAACLHEQYSDPTGDGGNIDATLYSIEYDCDTSSWVVQAFTPGTVAESNTNEFAIYVDRDINGATGCLGNDVVVKGIWTDEDDMVGQATDTPTCTTSSWSIRSETVTISFPQTEVAYLKFPHTVVGVGAFGWRVAWADNNEESDLLPNAGYNTTLRPGARSIQFRKAQYNAPGTDTNSNASLNNEWISIRNFGPATKNLKGYTVRDVQNNVFTFKSDLNLAADKSVRVHTGKGTNTATDVYWGRTTHVWGNTTDTATLRKPDKSTTDTCRWTTPGAGSKVCAT